MPFFNKGNSDFGFSAFGENFRENEVFKIKKTSGFSEAVQERETRILSVFDLNLSQFRYNENGNFGREKAREKRDA